MASYVLILQLVNCTNYNVNDLNWFLTYMKVALNKESSTQAPARSILINNNVNIVHIQYKNL